jgi:type IV secretory pathway VirB2 component (pilin)
MTIKTLGAMLAIVTASAGSAYAQATGSPRGSGPINAAVDWVQATLLGNIATTAAVIAVAVVGFMMLSGRVNWRHGAMVIVGCFVVFGATVIVAGIQTAAQLTAG